MANTINEKHWFYLLECPIRNYDWGNRKESGIINQLLQAQGNETIDNQPRAEMWMGSHSSSPSLLLPERINLDRAISNDPLHFLGPDFDYNPPALPFLLKVLDATKPLSIQAHPDKKLAKELHEKSPEYYPDNNHKPELAISLGEMRVLAGFRPVHEIADFISKIPELKELCGEFESSRLPPETDDDQISSWIKKRFTKLMMAESELVKKNVAIHLKRLRNTGINSEADKVFVELAESYIEYDRGFFCVYFLNFFNLNFGEALYISPNELHTYLGGEILECQATSDNVVRGGLTQKYCNADILVNMLKYNSGKLTVLNPVKTDSFHETYHTPTRDFIVHRLILQKEPMVLKNSQSSILIVLNGVLDIMVKNSKEKKIFEKGSVILLPGDLAAQDIVLELTGNQDTVVYQATINSDV